MSTSKAIPALVKSLAEYSALDLKKKELKIELSTVSEARKVIFDYCRELVKAVKAELPKGKDGKGEREQVRGRISKELQAVLPRTKPTKKHPEGELDRRRASEVLKDTGWPSESEKGKANSKGGASEKAVTERARSYAFAPGVWESLCAVLDGAHPGDLPSQLDCLQASTNRVRSAVKKANA